MVRHTLVEFVKILAHAGTQIRKIPLGSDIAPTSNISTLSNYFVLFLKFMWFLGQTTARTH